MSPEEQVPEPVPADDADATTFGCAQCGADLEFSPGAGAMKCPYCGHENPVPELAEEIEELDFRSQLAELEAGAATQEEIVIRCGSCAAQTTLPPDKTAGNCAFCGTPVVATEHSVKSIKPASLLPFKVDRKAAREYFKAWIGKRWFAPSGLMKFAQTEGKLRGMYVPYWTYDADTRSSYTGQRGEDYWVTETYTTTDAQGKTVQKTRQVRKTRWYSVSGRVSSSFDDVLVLASRSLPKKYADRLEPWDLGNLTPYADDYLSGFASESYQVDLAEGFDVARGIMDVTIRQTIRRDIGGDHQRIFSVNTSYRDITYKHLLLPVWLAAYRFREKTYRILVNARTGEVQGEQPWSFWKIFFAVLVVLVVIGGIVAAIAASQ